MSWSSFLAAALLLVAIGGAVPSWPAQADPPGRHLPFTQLAQSDDPVNQREIDQRFADLQREITDHSAADQRALVTALAAINERLAAMNEFRGAVNDLSRTMSDRITKLESAAIRIEINTGLISTIGNKVSVLETAGSPFAISQIEKLRGEIDRVAALANALETGGGTIARQSQRDIIVITNRLTEIEARASGAAQLWQILLAMAGFVVVVLGLWFAVHQRTVGIVTKAGAR